MRDYALRVRQDGRSRAGLLQQAIHFGGADEVVFAQAVDGVGGEVNQAEAVAG